ncbi:hypothetical protein K9N68_01600 [Kovacikia minuta CCNUW1]|uniref:hypothetical protein n=1 Tax=Kovacikia minuta TaxID=2931930 RepID=UPI001CC9E832|nr:hypothetical protein [Kovacikia minuta]UBF26724.1 hypothetical protein K9N68_01600 [Kovacikia minuta CCNUW1]
MIQVPLPSVGSSPAGHKHTELVHSDYPPFHLAPLSQTVLQIPDPSFLNHPTAASALFQPTVEAMQQLVALIHTLQLATPSSHELASPESFNLPLSPDLLMPYVSEEAYEVAEALQQEKEPGVRSQELGVGGDGEDCLTSPSSLLSPSSPSPYPLQSSLLTIEALTSYLLWSVVRSSYITMQLIEGVRAQQQVDETWTPGMVRLAILLIVKTPELDTCFDLATGCRPQSLLAEDEVLRLDDHGWFAGRSPSLPHQLGDRVENQLQVLLQQIQATNPFIAPLLEGLSLPLLQPGQNWQMAEIRLQLGFEFTVGEAESMTYQTSYIQSDLVEAELLEETAIAETSSQIFSVVAPASQVSVVELPCQPFSTSTLVRLSDPETLERYSQTLTHQHTLRAIASLQQSQLPNDPHEHLLHIITKADEIVHGTHPISASGIYLQQPIRLMQELMPKLLWQITRSSYEVMQLMGGVEVSILQPGFHWQQGTLRLLPALWFQASSVNCAIDLATGRVVLSPNEFLPPETVCQIKISPASKIPLQPSQFQHPLLVEELLSLIKQQIYKATPEIYLWMDGTPVEWLQGRQDWKEGTLHLKLGLEFMPDVHLCLS